MREGWTDERLDDLNQKVDELGWRMDDGFREMRAELSAVQRSMIQFASVMIAGLIGLFAAQIGLIATQI